jgi:hypothetical protein
MTSGTQQLGKKMKKKKKRKKEKGDAGWLGLLLAVRRLIPAARGGLMLALAGWAGFVPVRSGGLNPFFFFSFSNLTENCLLFCL